jgi:hypothetical protein
MPGNKAGGKDTHNKNHNKGQRPGDRDTETARWEGCIGQKLGYRDTLEWQRNTQAKVLPRPIPWAITPVYRQPKGYRDTHNTDTAKATYRDARNNDLK